MFFYSLELMGEKIILYSLVVRRNSFLKPSVKILIFNLCDLFYSYLLEPGLSISVF